MKEIYKYNLDEDKMIKVGVLSKENLVVLDSPTRPFYKLDVSLYRCGFYIQREEISKTQWSSNYEKVFPDNADKIGEVSTGAEGQNYIIGYINNGQVIFYDQYLLKRGE